MIEQLLLNFAAGVPAGLVVEGVKKLLSNNSNATKSEIKAEISNLTNIQNDDQLEQLFNAIKSDLNIVIGNNSEANGVGNIVIGNNRKINGSHNIIIGHN